jgi:hypothetical protein
MGQTSGRLIRAETIRKRDQHGGDEYFTQSRKLDVLRYHRSVARHLVAGECIDQTNEKPLQTSHDNPPLFIS